MGIIKKSGADVILMIETYGCSDNIADCLGYYHRLISDNLSIYSRYPIIKTYTFPGKVSTFNFGGAEIDVNGKHVRVFDTWLHYLPDARLVPTDKSEAEILAWDDEGSRDDEVRAILSALGPMMAEAGFKDSFREVNPDPVKNLGTTWFSDNDGGNTRMDRIDFIYYKGDGIKATKSEIHNAYLKDTLDFRGKKFLYSSDHGFVLTEFDIR